MKKILLLLFILSFDSSFATRYYVNAAATGSNTGLNWTNAYTNLQSALSIAIFGDEIWVAAGQYFPTTTSNRNTSFALKDGVNIYGGFNGTETLLSQRDIATAPTTLSGDIGELGDYTDNSYHVVRANTITSVIFLDGFRIINGNSNNRGGGLYVESSSAGNVTVRNCLFFSNRANNAGGAISLFNSRVTVDNCEFRNNDSDSGGAIFSETSGTVNNLYVYNSRFIGNSGDQGACIGSAGNFGDIFIDRSIFTNNTGGNYIIEIDGFDTGKIYNSYLIGNNLDEGSGNVVYVNEVQNENTENFEMVNTTIANNINTYQFNISSEMVYLDKAYYKVYNCIIYGNTPYQGRQLNPGRIVRNSLIEGGYAGGINILNATPMFINPNPSYTEAFDATAFNYRLQAGSPAQNSGDNNYVNTAYNFDLDGNPRIDQGIVDMGAYESAFLGIPPADFERQAFYFGRDSRVHFADPERFMNKKLEVFSMTGALIATTIIDAESVTVGITLPQGIYLIKIDDLIQKTVVH